MSNDPTEARQCEDEPFYDHESSSIQEWRSVARETIVILKDDLDGSDGAETIAFSIRGVDYEIDLSEKNAAAFDKSVSKWVGAARKITRPRQVRRNKSAVDARAVREWAARTGVEVSPRGRIPARIIEQYQQSV